MANDLYGELLARALQRRAPPGHFPAFVTPGEANLLRSYGGGVAPGGGQYMAGGIPAFFSEADPSGAPGSPSASGDDPSGGLGNIGAIGFGTGGGAFGGMAGEFGSMGFDIGNLGIVSEGDMGRSIEEVTRDYVLEQIERSRQKAEEEAAAARAAAAIEAQFQAQKVRSSFVTSPITVAPAPKATPVTPTPLSPTYSLTPKPVGRTIGTTSDAQAQANAQAADAQGFGELDQAVAEAQTQAQAQAQAQAENMMSPLDQQIAEIEQTVAYPTPVDETAEQQQANLDAAIAAVNEVGMPMSAALEALDAPISEGGMGRSSPAVSWGINSETGMATFSDLVALNASDQQGYAINNPQPTAASIAASQVFADLNPTITNAVIGITGMMPGTVGFVGFLAGLMEDKGLLNIPGVKGIPGVEALSNALAGIRTGVSDVTGKITGPITEQISELADVLSGDETIGFEDSGEVYGGEPEISVPPIVDTAADETEPLVKKPYVRQTPADVMARILAAKNKGELAVKKQRALV